MPLAPNVTLAWRLTNAPARLDHCGVAPAGEQKRGGPLPGSQDLQGRLRAFELALDPDKTRLVRFGRLAAKQRGKLGEGKPETFDFLAFTHFCTQSRKRDRLSPGARRSRSACE